MNSLNQKVHLSIAALGKYLYFLHFAFKNSAPNVKLEKKNTWREVEGRGTENSEQNEKLLSTE